MQGVRLAAHGLFDVNGLPLQSRIRQLYQCCDVQRFAGVPVRWLEAGYWLCSIPGVQRVTKLTAARPRTDHGARAGDAAALTRGRLVRPGWAGPAATRLAVTNMPTCQVARN